MIIFLLTMLHAPCPMPHAPFFSDNPFIHWIPENLAIFPVRDSRHVGSNGLFKSPVNTAAGLLA
jgi:hypothetical protein